MSAAPLDILVVDDNVESGFVMGEVLRRAGHQVQLAAGGNEAIRAATAHPPDAILMDIQLPDLGGFDAAKRIKTMLPQVKAIAISGLQIPAGNETDTQIFDGELHKPIGADQLLAVLRDLFGERAG